MEHDYAAKMRITDIVVQANEQVKRIIKRINNGEQVDIKVRAVEMKNIENYDKEQVQILYHNCDKRICNLSNIIEESIIKDLKEEKNFKANMENSIKHFPNNSLHTNPGSLKDSFCNLKEFFVKNLKMNMIIKYLYLTL
ncbi:hypothetical protein [Oceanirhabdus sp. W0125-5]|uniref:hypothetical protein n=1 Tax=Oceanirhabdus sp. W0125-5 TaxID=2999116 RepID=UPI0022F33006|nr:hypothetical protein [Oceanirhabdus sp. W0125-5]WBW95261.1 hypothetical protein OW730_16385 [Oceanirhabdus sp. W0125-5]